MASLAQQKIAPVAIQRQKTQPPQADNPTVDEIALLMAQGGVTNKEAISILCSLGSDLDTNLRMVNAVIKAQELKRKQKEQTVTDSPMRTIGNIKWLSSSILRKLSYDKEYRGHQGKVIQFTPWNSAIREGDNIKKTPEGFLTEIEKMKDLEPNFYFICTIIKQMNKGSVKDENSFTRGANIGFVKAGLLKNLDDKKNGIKITVDGFGAASNEAPSGDGILPSGGKKTITNGKECYDELIKIILDAAEKIVNETEYTKQDLEKVLVEMGIHFHAGEEYHEQVLNFLEAYVDDDRIPWKMKTIGHGVPQLGYACLHGTQEQKDQAYRIIGKIIDKKILMEYCPTSNKSIESTKSHESEDLHFLITNFLNMDQCITIGTDDPAFFASLEEEYNIVYEELLVKGLHKDVCAMTIRKFMSNSLKYCKTKTWTDDKLNNTEEKFPKVDTHTHIGALFKIPFLISELETLHTHIQELIRKTERVTNRLASSS